MTPPPDFLNSLQGSVAIIGVGLLGGSVAATVKRVAPQTRCVGYARSPSSARRLGDHRWLDAIETDAERLVADAAIVVVATPVGRIADWVHRSAAGANPDAVLTDVGSTKQTIVSATTGIANFCPAHPIAGSERSGPDAADDHLFDDKLTLLTPGRHTDASAIDRVGAFWRSLGCRTRTMDAADHDRALAAVSHVPHLVSALVAATTDPVHAELVGSGWRDITRVAAGDVEMWAQIIAENRGAIADQLRVVRDRLDDFLNRINDPDAVSELLAEARGRKLQIDASEHAT